MALNKKLNFKEKTMVQSDPLTPPSCQLLQLLAPYSLGRLCPLSLMASLPFRLFFTSPNIRLGIGFSLGLQWQCQCKLTAKVTVLSVLKTSTRILDTVQLMFELHVTYFYIVIAYADVRLLGKVVWTYQWSVFVGSLVFFWIQLFFAHRTYILSKGNRWIDSSICGYLCLDSNRFSRKGLCGRFL
jgi:hypothetical protein